MDVGTWLCGLGLGQYATAFRENKIEADTLPELNERVLRDIGVPLGHRLRMLRAIRELAAQAAIAVQPAAGQPALRGGAERRHMTVMFCDLVGLTALTAEFDPEDMADLLRASQRAIAAAVTRFDGHVAKWVGDGATIYFGYPRAHEDDAERAVRAGLAMLDAVAALGRKHAVQLAGHGLACPARAENRQPFRRGAHRGTHPLGRPRHRNRTSDRTLAPRCKRRGPGRADIGRGRYRQVAHPGNTARADRGRASHRHALSLLAASHQRRLLSRDRPDLAGGRLRQRRARRYQARQAGEDGRSNGIGAGR